jgi:glycine/D-amino acid oxidase-like deaminating enzyme
LGSADIIVIGGGLSGSAVALGLVRLGAGKVLLFDEQLPCQRLSRGNFGLTWYMCKGGNNPVYAKWCRMATEEWPAFAAQLEEETGYDLEVEWTGGAVHAVGEEQFATYAQSIESLREICRQAGLDYPARMISREEFAEMIPDLPIGEKVTGFMYAADQGHVNPLKLLGALRAEFQKRGGRYFCGKTVTALQPQPDGTCLVQTGTESFSCGKVVVATGHGTNKLLSPLGERLPIYPSRGQLLVTERHPRLLKIPVLAVRQTPDGTFIIGLSTEDTAHDSQVTMAAMKNQASNAITLFPSLARLNWVRAWGAVRVMTPDGAPIYSRLQGFPAITVIALHSAVSLAPLKISAIAPWILGQKETEQISSFSNGRFHV